MKKYIFRIGYILFLSYFPGVIIYVLRSSYPVMKTLSYCRVGWFNALNPLEWLLGEWPRCLWSGFKDGFTTPLVVFIFWLMWSWLKKPNFLKGALLLAVAVLLNPALSPWYFISTHWRYSPYHCMTFWMGVLAWLLYLLYRRLKKAGC